MSRFRSRLAMVIVAAVVAVTAPNVKSASNSSPVGVDDNFEVVEGTRLVVDAPGLLLNDSDPDGDPIASGFHSDPPSGAIVAMAEDGAFTYEPDPGFVGVDSFSYSVRDELGSFTSRVVEATITVTAAPQPAVGTASPAVLAGTGTTSDPLIPAALFGAGLLVIALAVRRARSDADERFEQA